MSDTVSTATASTLGTSVHQEMEFAASPAQVYEALLDEKQFAAFTRRPAQIDRREGGAFSLFGGRVTGRNVERIANERIIQAWRVMPWAPGVYSIVRFELQEIAGGRRLILDHSGFPLEDVAARAAGWQQNYWDKLRSFLAS